MILLLDEINYRDLLQMASSALRMSDVVIILRTHTFVIMKDRTPRPYHNSTREVPLTELHTYLDDWRNFLF